MKLIALGSGGWIPTESRHTSCYLVDTGESLIILDTGTGLSRLSKHLDILDKYGEINIIFSHYHLDHMVGLFYLANWCKEKKVNIYGPGKSLGFGSCEEIINGLITPPYYPLGLDKLVKEVRLMDYDLLGFKIGNIPIGITAQRHSGGSFRISIGDSLSYATDTTILEETFKAAEGKKLLLHECWALMNENSKDHSSFEEVSSMLDKYKIGKLGLVHINPNWTADKFAQLQAYFLGNQNIVIMEDEMEFDL